MPYEPRTYRRSVSATGLTGFQVVVAETDLHIFAESDLSSVALGLVRSLRSDLESYISRFPRFAESFVPIEVDDDAPPIAVVMAEAARAAGVGPMASVAGAFAEAVAVGLSGYSAEVIVENGGDVYLCGKTDRVVGLWAGDRGPEGVALAIGGSSLPVGIATSSGTVGPSVSLGSADAATVLAHSGALADAVASAVGNRVRSPDDIGPALEYASSFGGVIGAVVSIEGSLGAWGDVRFERAGPLRASDA